MMDFFTVLGKQLPSAWESKVAQLLWEAGERKEAAAFLGKIIVLFMAMFIFTSGYVFINWQTFSLLLEKLYLPNNILIQLLVSLGLASLVVLLLGIIIYSWLTIKADMRRTMLESILPDFLTLVSSNLRSGMSFDEALWNAAKPEFGLFAREVRSSIKEAFSGKPVDQALDDLARKFNSPLFKRTIAIIKQSIRTGGELATVLDKLAEDIREVSLVREDIKTNLLVYILFLFFASSLGMPFLFAVSLKMVSVLFSVFSLSAGLYSTGEVLAGVSISPPPITEETFYYFSLITLFVSTVMTALIMGAAYGGRISAGIKYIPFMVLITYAVFFIASSILDYVFQNLVI